ncbi:MAG: hypothetical protein IPN88_12445 [Bacteroidetes bacterium]|nr:hypothetical protein [Bacteroidota bacterium]
MGPLFLVPHRNSYIFSNASTNTNIFSWTLVTQPVVLFKHFNGTATHTYNTSGSYLVTLISGVPVATPDNDN